MIDDQFIDALGLGSVNQEEKDKMKAHIEETLKDRIGERVEKQLDEAKLSEFETLIDQNDQTALNNWLQMYLPSYPQIVKEEVANLVQEIKPQVADIVQSNSTAS